MLPLQQFITSAMPGEHPDYSLNPVGKLGFHTLNAAQ
jgi:hypothetical protein